MAKRRRIIVSCRFVYVNCFTPKNKFGEKKYSVTILIPKDDAKTVKDINEAIEFTKEESKDKWNGRIPGNLHVPLHDGDEDKPDKEYFRNNYYMNAKSEDPPQIVDKNVCPIENHSELYPGCYGNVSLLFYGYNCSGNKGIGVILCNIQKTKDGPKFSKRITAADEFSVVK